MNTDNDFMRLRAFVSKVVSQYNEVRIKAKFPDSGKNATIQNLAKPFLTGYFTIAIAGKMSAGKSTFINSLIGEKLLPSGHFQTTSCITWIVSSDKRLMEVTYADGNKKTFNSNFAQELQKLVAVPEEFDTLPINDINTLIRGNNDISTILKKKAGIEKNTGTSSSESLWKKYVRITPKSKIVDKVVIYLPLPKEYEGWRIVDTPGVGAIGGIQNETLRLFSSSEEDSNQKLVDAVVLLHKGTENIQDESANKFAEDVSKSMGDMAKGRIFFVLTHSSSQEFLNNKQGILLRANNLFGRKLSIPEDRITYVDSLVQRFIVDAKKSGNDFSTPQALYYPLPDWGDEWTAIQSILYPIYFKLQVEGKEVSNSTLFDELDNSARFNILRDKLNDFLNNEKQNAFDKLLTLIENELKRNEARFRQEIEAVSNGPEGINKAINEIQDEYTRLEAALILTISISSILIFHQCSIIIR